jgi:2-oxoglutarate ferredoxin oxidoreductase subunit delta
MNGQGFVVAVVALPEECTGCAICAESCPDVCIRVWR